jgi:hypothetical protein
MTEDSRTQIILGRLLERSEAILHRLNGIDGRLETGDRRMGEMTDRIAALERRKKDAMPAIERGIKVLLPYLIGLVTLAATGSIEKALQIVTGLTGK